MTNSKMTIEDKLDDICGMCSISDECPWDCENNYCPVCRRLERDLQDLERLLKFVRIIKKKKVNMWHLYTFDDYKDYSKHYMFSEYHCKKDMLTKTEFTFLKEVLRYVD